MNSKRQSWYKRLFAVRGMGQVVTVSLGLIVMCVVFGIINYILFREKCCESFASDCSDPVNRHRTVLCIDHRQY